MSATPATVIAFNPPPPNAQAMASEAPGRLFDVACELSYQVDGPSDFLFQVHALQGHDQQVLSEHFELTPALPVHVFADPIEQHRFARVHVAQGPLRVHYRARVRRAPLQVDSAAGESAIAELPDLVLRHLLPSRYCESDLLSHAAQKIFGQQAPGYARVCAVVDWIHSHIDYQLGSSDATTTACQVFTRRAGVCRDFAHLGVTFCRALNIPARLVAAYARFDEPPPDFHAVFEAFVGGQWVMFDATRMSPLDELVRIASGRDAKDLAFATIFGPASMTSMNPTLCAVAGDLPASNLQPGEQWV